MNIRISGGAGGGKYFFEADNFAIVFKNTKISLLINPVKFA